jgi:hypothetical protein
MPVKAEEPVNEYVPDMPEGFFMKASGELSEVMKAPLQRARPWPNLALKSPMIIRGFLKSYDSDTVYACGHGDSVE